VHFEILIEDKSGKIALESCEWAGKISPHMDVDNNQSPSFKVFRDGLRSLAGMM